MKLSSMLNLGVSIISMVSIANLVHADILSYNNYDIDNVNIIEEAFDYLEADKGLTPCKFKVDKVEYDLTPIKDIVAEFTTTDEDKNTFTYLASFCQPISGNTLLQRACKNANAAVCQVYRRSDGDYEDPARAIVSSAEKAPACDISHVDPKNIKDGLKITCKNTTTKQCPAENPPKVVLVGTCDKKAKGIENFVLQTGLNTCEFIGSFSSPSMCEQSSFSITLLVVILLLVAIFLYILIGCIVNAQKGETTAYRRCPHVEFWIAIPTVFVTCFNRIYYTCKGREPENYETEYDNGDEASYNATHSYGTLA